MRCCLTVQNNVTRVKIALSETGCLRQTASLANAVLQFGAIVMSKPHPRWLEIIRAEQTAVCGAY